MDKKTAVSLILAAVGLAALIAFSPFGALFAALTAVAFAAVEFAYRKFRGRPYGGARQFPKSSFHYFKRMCLGFFSLAAVFVALDSYVTYLSPFSTPVSTYENGSGGVVKLVGMVHVGKDPYYKETEKIVKGLKAEGFTVFYEGVRAGSKEAADEFSDYMGIKVKPKMYEDIAKLLELEEQSSYDVQDAKNPGSVNVDLRVEDLLAALKAAGAKKMDSELLEASANVDVEEAFSKLTPLGRTFVKKAVYGGLSLLSENEETYAKLLDAATTEGLSATIIGKRNEHVSKKLSETMSVSGGKAKIAVVYGSMHMPGISATLESAGFSLAGTEDRFPFK